MAAFRPNNQADPMMVVRYYDAKVIFNVLSRTREHQSTRNKTRQPAVFRMLMLTSHLHHIIMKSIFTSFFFFSLLMFQRPFTSKAAKKKTEFEFRSE